MAGACQIPKNVPKLIASPFAILFLQNVMYLNIAKEYTS